MARKIEERRGGGGAVRLVTTNICSNKILGSMYNFDFVRRLKIIVQLSVIFGSKFNL